MQKAQGSEIPEYQNGLGNGSSGFFAQDHAREFLKKYSNAEPAKLSIEQRLKKLQSFNQLA